MLPKLLRSAVALLLVGSASVAAAAGTTALGDHALGRQPGAGTFASRDSYSGQLQTPISLNRYTYASANPLGMWDPDGHAAQATGVCNADVGELSSADFGRWVEGFAGGGGQAGCAAGRAEKVDAVVKVVTSATTTVAGFVPGLGDAMDVYACVRGDKLSCVAAVPLIGSAANVVKGIRSVDNVVDAGRAVSHARDLGRTADGVGDVRRSAGAAHDVTRVGDAAEISKTRRLANGVDGTHDATKANDARRLDNPIANTHNPSATEAAGGVDTGTDLVKYDAYPPAATSPRGFVGAPVRDTLQPGTAISRYGGEGGTLASPAGTPFSARGLPPDHEALGESRYIFAQPLEVDAGIAAYWQGGGGGIQYDLPRSISDLVNDGVLKRLS